MSRDYTRPVPAPRALRGVRDLLREHLNHAGITQEGLARIWDMHPASARRLLNPKKHRRNDIKPAMIDAVVVALKLDEFDAEEMHYRAAIEFGFKINRVSPLLTGGP